MYKIAISRATSRLLICGLFVILCHISAIVLYSSTLPFISTLTFSRYVFPMLEHSLVSLVAIFIGALGIEYIEKEKRS